MNIPESGIFRVTIHGLDKEDHITGMADANVDIDETGITKEMPIKEKWRLIALYLEPFYARGALAEFIPPAPTTTLRFHPASYTSEDWYEHELK